MFSHIFYIKRTTLIKRVFNSTCGIHPVEMDNLPVILCNTKPSLANWSFQFIKETDYSTFVVFSLTYLYY